MAETKAANILETKLKRISVRSVALSKEKFGKLMPLFNKDNLIQCFHELNVKSATGVDKQTKERYAENLAENIERLIERMKAMSYRPQPVREVLIPKDDGGQRPLGISTVEDKIIQLLCAKVLEAIFEPHFRNSSYGFRPNRNCHQAIREINNYLFSNWHPVIIDADVKNYFGTIDHEQMLEFLRLRIDDEQFLRYIVRILKSGILRQSGLERTDEGSTQGASWSPRTQLTTFQVQRDNMLHIYLLFDGINFDRFH